MKAKDISKFIISGLMLLALLFIADRTVGWWLANNFYKQKHGDDLVSIYVAEKANEDILIMGGSRASHHYITTDIEAQTKQSCFNGGRDDMDIIYISAMLDLVFQRYTPKTIILDVTPLELADYDGRKAAVQKASTALLPFSPRHPELFATINLPNKLEKLKAQISHIYPYNSLAGSIIQNTYTHLGHTSIKGYEPLSGYIDSSIYKESIWDNYIKDYKPYTECVQRMDNVIANAKKHNIRLLVIISPFYFPFDFYNDKNYLALKNKVESSGFEFYDFSHSAPYLHNPYLFKDDIHLNDSGAVLYTQEITRILNSPAHNL